MVLGLDGDFFAMTGAGGFFAAIDAFFSGTDDFFC